MYAFLTSYKLKLLNVLKNLKHLKLHEKIARDTNCKSSIPPYNLQEIIEVWINFLTEDSSF